MTPTSRRMVRIAVVALVLSLCVRAGWEAASPAELPAAVAVAANQVSGLVLPATHGASRLRAALIGNWDERGGSGVVLDLGPGGAVTLDLHADGATACVESGTFMVAHNDLAVTYLAAGQTPAGYGFWSIRETLDYADGHLVMPADGGVFTKQG